jgi:hypothetical protein
LLTGNPPALITTGSPGWPEQGIDGIYNWGDSSPDASTPIGIQTSTPDLVEDIIFFNDTQRIGYAAYSCPHPLTGLSGSCDSSAVGINGYNVESVPDTTPPAQPTGLTVN